MTDTERLDKLERLLLADYGRFLLLSQSGSELLPEGLHMVCMLWADTGWTDAREKTLREAIDALTDP